MLIRLFAGSINFHYFLDSITDIHIEKRDSQRMFTIVSDISSFSGENVKNERLQNVV